MSHAIGIRIFGSIVGVTGFVALGLHVSWWAAFGVLLMIFGNNLEKRAEGLEAIDRRIRRQQNFGVE